MFDAEEIRFIREEIKKQIRVVAFGSAGTNTQDVEDVQQLYPGMPNIEKVPVSAPYGYASRAPQDTIEVTARVGEHPGNRVVLGHRAPDRPTGLAVGEMTIYSKAGYAIRVRNDKIEVGKGGEFEPVVVGETLKELLIAVLDAIASHTHIGNSGFDTSPPKNAADFTGAKADFLDNDKILAQDGGRF